MTLHHVWDEHGVRYYLHPVHRRVAPSVHTVINGPSGTFQSQAMERGRSLHQRFQHFMVGQVPASGTSSFDRRVSEFLDVYEPDVVATEQPLWGGSTARGEYGGTCDLRARIRGHEVCEDPGAHAVHGVARGGWGPSH